MAKTGKDILITPWNTGDPQILFRGSGVAATGFALNVQSGSDLSFSGAYGEVFNVGHNYVTFLSGVRVNEYIYHSGDNDTYIQFSDDEIQIAAGGRTFIKMEEASTDKIMINHGALDIDFQVKGENDANLIRTDAESDRVGIGLSSPAYKLDVYGSGNFTSGIMTSGVTLSGGAIKTPLISHTDGTLITFDLNSGNTQGVTLGGNRTLAIVNEHVGQKFMLRLLQDGSGSRTVTWFSTIKWAGGSAPTLTTTASKADVVGFLCTAADAYDGFVVGQNI